MKIFKSIKWRLQIWYGLILVLVLAGFGFTAYQLQRQELRVRVYDELEQRFGIIADALHRRGPAPEQSPFGRPPSGQIPGDFPPLENHRPNNFELPPQAAYWFDSNNPHQYFFEVYRGNHEIAFTNLPPAIFRKNGENGSPGLLVRPNTIQIIHRYNFIIHDLPSGETIIVGCSFAPELRELKMTALKLSGVGGIILFFGLVGGGWLVSRAIKPIEQISSAATKISAGDLSQRISVAEAESELGQLAMVLNSTFARLEAAFAQQKQFASDAAHELRTPVSVILTQTQTALNREREAADYKQTVQACQRAAQRMRKLISALLELARLDAGREQMKRLKFDLAQTARDCVELICPLADERGVKIISELEPLEITGDSERLAQIVTNLLTNAVQYNHDGGETRVKLESQSGLAILSVSDNGVGIAAEDLPRVFERFYRADKSRSSGNAGLGLAICKAIVAAHGGTIEVSSEENIGTTFMVRLPMA